MEKKNKLHFVCLLLLSYFVGFLIMAFFQTPAQMEWYKTLNQSPIAPPAITFSIVWGILYFLMAVSAWIVCDKVSLGLFYGQYAIQLIWSFVFFQCHWLWTGFIIMLLLCLTTTAITIRFYKTSHLSGLLFLPYTAWCFFATLLNLTVAWLN